MRIRIALNFGPNKDTPVEKVAADYAALMARLGAARGFHRHQRQLAQHTGSAQLAVAGEDARNVRRDGAGTDAVRAALPMLLKVAPDLDDAMLDAICDTAMALRLDGMVVCNTTLEARRGRRDIYRRRRAERASDCATSRATASPAVYRRTQGKLPIIGVGGIMNAVDALGHIKAGREPGRAVYRADLRGAGTHRVDEKGTGELAQTRGISLY